MPENGDAQDRPGHAAVLRGGQMVLESMTRAAATCGPRPRWDGLLGRPDTWRRCLARAAEPLADAQSVLDAVVGLLAASQEGWQEGHIRRMMARAEELAVAAGLCPEQVRAVRWGAALHDIGKARVPQAILQKPGPLDAQEYGEIRQHPDWGVELLASLPSLPPQTLAAVQHHHERWDGGGYPAGLRRRRIPLSARIVGLADVYDALTSARPYKPAWSAQGAARYLLNEAGGQFDPGLTRLFVRDVLNFGELIDPGAA
jgi:putative nucleotidyltransferase with HDIG domain